MSLASRGRRCSNMLWLETTEGDLNMNSWNKLFISDRITSVSDGIVKQEVSAMPLRGSSSTGRTDFERDYCRVAYSSQFRRLAGKTQILPETKIDHVRNRLTHSVEVSTIASSIFREYETRLERKQGVKIPQSSDAHWVLRTAGLAHDLGNPPYGHAGENAIREWARGFFGRHPQYSILERDFELFDGNAQSFRLLSRDDLGFCSGISLTLTSLAAIVKYPYSVSDKRSNVGKFNAFRTENDVLDLVMSRHDLKCPNGYYRRHPLSFFLEAADDIAYILSDIEDAVYAGIITDEAKAKLYAELTKPEAAGRRVEAGRQVIQSAVASVLINGYAKAFYDSQNEIFTNRHFTEHELEDALPKGVRDWLPGVKSLRKRIIVANDVKNAETRGAQMISQILNALVEILPYVGGSEKSVDFETLRIIDRSFGCEFFERNKHRADIWWLRMILDYVSGMTDKFLDDISWMLR